MTAHGFCPSTVKSKAKGRIYRCPLVSGSDYGRAAFSAKAKTGTKIGTNCVGNRGTNKVYYQKHFNEIIGRGDRI
jgi:hypothetical protein